MKFLFADDVADIIGAPTGYHARGAIDGLYGDGLIKQQPPRGIMRRKVILYDSLREPVSQTDTLHNGSWQ